MKIHPDWKIKEEVINENIKTMFKNPPSYFRKRLEKIGFFGKDKIMLDAGCGAGYWSIAGTYLNKKVYGIDITPKYLAYAKILKSRFKKRNLGLILGKIEKLPYENNFFDYIISYSVWMFTDKNQSLKEFYRVLKPGGKLYLGSITGPAWYPGLIIKGLKLGRRELIISGFISIFRGLPLSTKKTGQILERNNFQVLEIAGDGEIGEQKIKVKPILPAKFLGFWNIYEILAIKKLDN
ncbi:MAG: hypothetical protein US31_C0002G0123 [Berkelbacteria bacterium GW2011_GWA1_36_9]|uniref:Methyltransferase domain-containing protein n=1 Tax=Berkelbacteria bacterium GW2011_GWA1_36_9 TaxID=1618331 RepID=A0A0G0FIB1_9BACT|nr:MAG: hypothetical protein US31_C0002G0123 [Berkelbacteria bacterium GW2011_GWA1_36_9]